MYKQGSVESTQEINNKNPKFKIDDIVRLLKYKNIFGKGYPPNCSEKVFVTKTKYCSEH